MITIIRTKPFPKCKVCGKRMDYYILGLPDKEHAHPKCEGKAMAQEIMAKLKLDFGELRETQ